MDVFIKALAGFETGWEQENRLEAIPDKKVTKPMRREAEENIFIFYEKQVTEFWYEKPILLNGWN